LRRLSSKREETRTGKLQKNQQTEGEGEKKEEKFCKKVLEEGPKCLGKGIIVASVRLVTPGYSRLAIPLEDQQSGPHVILIRGTQTYKGAWGGKKRGG